MGLYLYSTECAECGQEIKDGERVIVRDIEGGNYREESSDIELDDLPIEQEVRHKKCWMEKPDDDSLISELHRALKLAMVVISQHYPENEHCCEHKIKAIKDALDKVKARG
jgi:hypothetical protein